LEVAVRVCTLDVKGACPFGDVELSSSQYNNHEPTCTIFPGGECMKVKVDEDICIGSGNCASTCPQVFELINGVSHVKIDVVPAELEKKAKKAVDDCPVSAISVVG